MDVVYRQDVIDHFRKRLIETANNNVGYQCDAGSVFQDVAERIRVWANEVPNAQPESQWIPCTERLPEDVGLGEAYPTVIYCTDKGEVAAGWYEVACKTWWRESAEDDVIHANVIAWMPLPKPWKEEE